MNMPALWALLATLSPAADATLDADGCVKMALEQSARIEESAAKLREWQARLAEVQSLYYPKLSALAYVAPMFTVEGDAASYERRWRSVNDWGPYTHLEAVLAQPLFSFGRITAAEQSAEQRALVEQARVRETENVVALEVRRLYHLRLFALSMLPSLDEADKSVTDALARAQLLYDQATGEVSQADLQKLRIAQLEIARFRTLGTEGAALALSALKHTLGLGDDAALNLVDERLPPLDEKEPEALETLLARASENRPEWAQLGHGKRAAAALREAELKSNLPVLFLGASVRADWAPTRTDATNPFHNDPYNGVSGGLALGAQLNLDPARVSARGDATQAQLAQLEALERFARTGIPLQVRKAHRERSQARKLAELTSESVKAARKWLTFAAAAYQNGAGDARDVLEGLAAFMQARRSYFESLRDFHLAEAELRFATGSR